MVPTSAADGPIPPAKKDDSEDVAWALSTSEAMYARGDRGDALKWLRRAAEAASEAQADDRALELAKAAADLATAIGPTTSARPPAPPPPPVLSRPAPAPPAASAPPPAPASAPAPPLVIESATATARLPALSPTPPRTASTAPPPPASSPAPPTARPADLQAAPQRPAFASPLRPGEPRRARRSRPDITIARAADEVTQQVPPPGLPRAPADPARRRRGSRPPAAEAATPAFPPLVGTPQPNAVPPPPPTPRALPIPEEIDAWPTQSLAGDDLADPPDEKTRIGVPAYQVTALAPEAGSPAPRTLDPTLKPAQAVRVVVWRAADGVHVAPQGTRVSAISVDAILVALDPSADLAAWLSGK
jgi:hypothetical protein